MRVGIKFGDNDFYNTLMPFIDCLEVIYLNRKYDKDFTKQEIVDLFNEIAFPLYCVCQSSCIQQERQKDLDRLRDVYLKIDESRVYFDEEIDELMKTINQWVNKDFFYIDLDNGQTGCY